jgi:hypothetical protein
MVVFEAGGGGLLLLTHPANPSRIIIGTHKDRI